jgi:uncharacterized protein
MKNNQLINIVYVFLALILVSLFACKKENKVKFDDETISVDDYNRQLMLTNYTNSYILPAYSAYKTDLLELYNETQTFTATPTLSNLQQLRVKWKDALLVWQDVAFLEFGPAEYIALRSQTNVYPADTSLILNNINVGSYNLQSASNYSAKGFQSVDYLISGISGNDQEIVDYFTSNTNAKTYLKDVVNELKTNAEYVYTEWSNSYASTFIGNSSSNAQGSSVSDLVNALNLHFETYIRKGKIGLPSGVFNGFTQTPMPNHVEAMYIQESLPYVYRSLSSFHKFINGNSYITNMAGEGFDDYLIFINATSSGIGLETAINNQISSINDKLNLINDPLSNEVLTNNQAVKDVYQQMQMLVPKMKIELTDALGVLITYQDNDGD